MDAARTPAVPKTYIPTWIKLDFTNDSNLKTDIQNRISDNTEAGFIDALNNMKGDNKNGYGISFSDVVLWALAYFYSLIFKDKIKDSYYSLEMVKGFLDGNNLTSYTAIHEIDVTFYKLSNAPLFRHCWLIIQSAWCFNSQYYGHHQHIDYLNHYITTGQKLPIDNYNFDRNYLEKKYNDIDTATTKKIPINGSLIVSQWYYSILFLVCNELKLSTKHFNISRKDNREYNPLTKTSRQLRPLTPFKIVECDIKSAFPTFLDVETGACLKDTIYNNLMLSKGITRNEAKVLFNTVCNSGAYKTKAETTTFFLECGYTQQQCAHLITLTHDPKRTFFSYMTQYESLAIQHFTNMNNLQRGTRLHDAIVFIDDKTIPAILTVHPNCDFGLKEMNRPVIKEYYGISNKRLPSAYVSSIPQGLKLIVKHDDVKPALRGEANGFRFYNSAYRFISARFNLNDYFALKDTNPIAFFLRSLEIMLSTLKILNQRNIKPLELEIILKHIRANSNFVFNVRSLYLRLVKYDGDPCLVSVKTRDFDFTGRLVFKKKIDFLNALNGARKLLNVNDNYYNLVALIQERITNDDYGYLNEAIIKGHKRNNALTFAIIKKFNLLCSGLHRKRRKQVKSEPLYSTTIKRLLLKSLSLKPQQQNAFMQKGIKKYERELKALNRLVNNRVLVQQLILVLAEVAGVESELVIIKDETVVMLLKAELMAEINKTNDKSVEDGAKEFDLLFKKTVNKAIEPISKMNGIFSNDLSNSIFNHIPIEDANARGDVFFNEYLKFNEIDRDLDSKKALLPANKHNTFPDIDF